MASLIDVEALEERANNLGTLNGMRMLHVALEPVGAPTEARITLHFYNENLLAAIVADPAPADVLAPIHGGQRRRGSADGGPIKVSAIAAGPSADTLELRVAPLGDYSTYTLELVFAGIDPVFAQIPFKFRPACFSGACKASPVRVAPSPPPQIDYLARDYDSLRHTLIAALKARVPGWEPTSEADLTLTLLELLAVSGDELSDLQDRVMSEAYLATSRRRVSLARHARLVDYFLQEGHQATGLLALTVDPSISSTVDLAAGFVAWAGEERGLARTEFVSVAPGRLHRDLNALALYTWSGARPGLDAGSCTADLAVVDATAAANVEGLIRAGDVRELVIAALADPRTGNRGSADPRHRQRVRLLEGSAGAIASVDPLTGASYVRVRWRREDALLRPYCFRARGADGITRDELAGFWGNLLAVSQGEVIHVSYHPPTATPPGGRSYSRSADGRACCELGEGEPLLYRPLDLAPGLLASDVPPVSTLSAMVSSGSTSEAWREVISLVGSKGQDPDYAVETDERGRSRVLFGDGTNGRPLADDAVVHLRFQTGYGPDGNLGADRLASFDHDATPALTAIRNPFDLSDGAPPEDPQEALRRIPEAFRARQLRAVTLCDYAKAAMAVDGVAKAAARYTWTGSFRCVHLAVDPVGSDTLTPLLRARVAQALAPRRLLGEELRIFGPRFVALAITVTVCARPEIWAADLRAALEDEFTSGLTLDGRLGFFHPDRWTFGQALRASEALGRIHALPGVAQVVSLTIQRHDAPTPGSIEEDGEVTIAADEIIMVDSDPDHRERGSIDIDVRGGRG